VNTEKKVDAEKLWGRRWISHLLTLAMTAGYLVAVGYWDAPEGAVWPLVVLALGYYGPAFAEAVTDAMSAVRGGSGA